MPRAKKTKGEKTAVVTETVVMEKPVAPKKLFGANLVIGTMLFIVVAGALGFGGYFYLQYQKMLKNQPVVTQSETQLLVEKIRKFVDLPTDEEPTMAEVKDTEKLKGQLFFSSAQNGDKVLIYSKNKKAVLYRPATDKIIEVTSLATKTESVSAPETENVVTQPDSAENAPAEKPAEESAGTDQSAAPTEEVAQLKKIVVYNGTKTKGLAGKLADEISAGVAGVEIVKTGNSIGDYAKTVVVDLSGTAKNNTETVQKIIEIVGGEAGALPEGEIKPTGDILVIGGEK